MSHWYDAILKEFIPEITPITLAADPDGLLSEENLQQETGNWDRNPLFLPGTFFISFLILYS
ncbi:MAG: hypothetical protein JSV88_12965 [Candidatus Aminicenantes bacterium]|nr:MAG: hypothetical protein JSV88_12965 [Candidatus Aminicenantes bacterium]